MDLTRHWLVLRYVLAAAVLLIAVFYHMPFSRRVAAVSASSPDDRPSPELQALIDAPMPGRARHGRPGLAIIFVMVVLPFS